MSSNDATVFVVDDEIEMRNSLKQLIESVGMAVKTFPDADTFLEFCTADQPGCILLDVRMPGMSGIEMHRKLVEKGIDLPVIFISAHGDIPMAVHALKGGAVDFLEKPFRPQTLLERISEGLRLDEERRRQRQSRGRVAKQLERLTPREREVMQLLVQGRSVKEIAGELTISPKTVQIHRSNIMDKTQAGSVVDLVRIAMTSEGGVIDSGALQEH